MTETIDFIGEIHPLIAQFREMTTRHQSRLAAYLDTGGEVIDEHRQEFEEAAMDQDDEAYGQLITVMQRLTELCGSPLPGRAHTLTFAGPERHDGEAPYLFVVNGDDLTDARRNLGSLPFFHEWYEQQRSWDEPEEDPDVVFLSGPQHSHPGIPDGGYYNDLRREQAVLWDAESIVCELAAKLPELEG
ncbi:hypothetical protein ABR737_01075 [Streptomyces sp. Edi2]|uniref:hypothetical protein n=1 Tax=Streptomyces sp. Edi2 TaxID=3162528 RepID=UPI0033064644